MKIFLKNNDENKTNNKLRENDMGGGAKFSNLLFYFIYNINKKFNVGFI